MSPINNLFASRIKQLMQDRRMTQQALADELGVSKQTISLWWQGMLPRDEKRAHIAKALGTTESYLFYGGRVPTANIGEAIPNSATAGFAVIRALADHEEGSLRLSNTTLAQCRVATSDARYLSMPDNSMSPAIPQGSLLAVDVGTRSVVNGKLYLFKQGASLRVARAYGLPGGGVRLRFDNGGEYPDESYPVGDTLYPVVIARVFWYSVSMP